MTGRRRRERRDVNPDILTGCHDEELLAREDRRVSADRREFLRRFSDLGAELEALQRPDRKVIMATLAMALKERGVET